MMKFKYLTLFICFVNFHCGFSVKKQLLSGQWNLRNGNNSISVKGKVPGGIYSDLEDSKILQDIYYRFNDINYRWVANETWIYSHIFQVKEEYFDRKIAELIFEGLDTFSTIFLNGIQIGSSNNMFLKYKFNIKPLLKNGDNNLTVEFKSAIHEANKLYETQSQDYIVPPICVPKEYRGECHVNHIRKMQASFSWDWGPAFPSVGIWKPVYILYYSSAVVADVAVNITENEEMWDINLQVYLTTNATNSLLAGLLATTLSTDFNNVTVFTTVYGQTNQSGEYRQKVSFQIPRAQVNLWWPNGYGEQKLYNMKLKYTPANIRESSVKNIKIGFRKIELIQNSISGGLSFYFKVNGIAMFSKGSNWIPANILPEKGASVTELRYLLESAKDVHMNMLRVWGGGVYESEEFYDLADELGILIWQDFMFACSMYPVNREFLDSVKLEVEQQVRRLQHHPSVALWAGNNENEVALRGNWYGTSRNFSLYKRDYVILYVDTIKEVCLLNDQSRPFVVSSPSNGLMSEKEGYVANNPYDTHYGDIHYYNYIADGWNKNIYSKPRFSSEYGFQSVPSYSTMASSTNVSADLAMDSEFLNSRQHHLAGYGEIKLLINKHLQLPLNSTNSINYLKTYIYYSQISQAMSYKAETEFYRQWRNSLDSAGNGFTMGALYWQLNDVWPAPSWSSIDFRHRWKMVHYFARKFFAPLLITAHVSPSQQMTIFAISDLTTVVHGANITVSVYSWKNLKPIHTEYMIRTILPGFSAIIKEFWLEKYLEDVGCGVLRTGKSNCFVYFSIRSSDGENLGPDNFVFPAPLKTAVGLSTPNLKVKVSNSPESGSKSTIFNVTISTDRITPFVWLETDDFHGEFSDNGFLQVTKYRTVEFKSRSPITVTELQSSLRITSLLGSEHLSA